MVRVRGLETDSQVEGGDAMLQEFKEFIAKGNLVTLAVAFILGLAFATVVTAFTDVVLGFVSYIFGATCPSTSWASSATDRS